MPSSLPGEIVSYCQSHARIERRKRSESEHIKSLKEREKRARESVDAAMRAGGECVAVDVGGEQWYVRANKEGRISLTPDMVRSILDELTLDEVGEAEDVPDAVAEAFKRRIAAMREEKKRAAGKWQPVASRHKPKDVESPAAPTPELEQAAREFVESTEATRAACKRVRESTKNDRETCTQFKENVVDHIKREWPTELSTNVRVKSPKSGTTSESTLRCVRSKPRTVSLRVAETHVRALCGQEASELALRALAVRVEGALVEHLSRQEKMRLSAKTKN